MENLDIRSVLPILQQFGISPDQLGPERLEELMKLSEYIHNPSDITPEIARQVMEILGISAKKPHSVTPVKRKSVKVGRNEACPCNSGKKFKKCCGDVNISNE